MKTNKKILVVDDQEDLREQLAKLLRKAGQKDETLSLVEQMRARLLGKQDSEKEPLDDTTENEDVLSYVVDIASQGKEAFQMVEEANKNDEPYAVIFLDMRMPPGWDGLETATKIREIDKSIEIVIMTAYADHDQNQIAEQIGMPEKLLYIKKPFQAEEIYQLALSLTSKYTIESREKERKQWLETLLRGMSRLKSSDVSDGVIYKTVLQSIINFTQAKNGFIAENNGKEKDSWINVVSIGIDDKDAKAYLYEKADSLKESQTTQKVNGKYILPLRKEKFFVVAVIDDVTTSTDPEWYKLLSLLLMTCSEILHHAYVARQHIAGKKDAATKDNVETVKKVLQQIKDQAKKLTDKPAETHTIADKIISLADDAMDKF